MRQNFACVNAVKSIARHGGRLPHLVLEIRDTAVFIRDTLFNTETQHKSVFEVPLNKFSVFVENFKWL
jgi:hypothetical protein